LRVKICGITNLEDAVTSVKHGADALGFVFYENSPRYISPLRAKEITKELPPFITKVGLFVNAKANEIEDICKISGMNIAQLHFEADSELLKRLNFPYLQVVRARSKDDVLKASKIGDYILVDSFVESYGGVGKRVELEWFEGVDCSKMIIAGGLNSENVKELKRFDFYGVDVSSGVEKSKGKKDKIEIEKFIKAVKNG
jgi:phosphoribosylanthranilate isomerase